MTRNRLKLTKKSAIILICFFVTFTITAEIITNPSPTHKVEGKKFVELKLVKEISSEKEYDEFFLVNPTSIAMDKDGFLYVYDRSMTAIYKFDQNLKFITKWGNQGRGPGEFFGNSSPYGVLYFGKEGFLRVCDNRNLKIMVFSTNGELKKEIPLEKEFAYTPFFPLPGESGNYYTISIHGGSIDRWNSINQKVQTYLSLKEYDKFLLYQPPQRYFRGRQLKYHWNLPSIGNTSYENFAGNNFVIFISNSASFFVFRNNKLFKRFNLWIPEELIAYKKRVETLKTENEMYNGEGNTYMPMLSRIIKDNDDDKTFYVKGAMDKKKRYRYYHFDLNGELLNVYFAKEPFRLIYKGHNRFFGLIRRNIKVFEIKK